MSRLIGMLGVCVALVGVEGTRGMFKGVVVVFGGIVGFWGGWLYTFMFCFLSL